MTSARRRAEEALDELGLRGPATVDALVHHLAEQRQRPLLVETAPAAFFADTACGAWWESEHLDLVFVPEDADPVLRDHTIRHELAHMILRHRGSACAGEVLREVLARVLPDLDPDTVMGSLHRRSDYGVAAEREAEVLASLLTLRDATDADRLGDREAEALRHALSGRLRRG
ncbi:hypothetical protein [Cellulomonas cellasea]|uniref:IrrE N-terminal-like domain-containing protein n=1 Tax=Cellulomonas cellasea TaxID=43670 RepID=A0A7W4UG98_9CELL|nr:hypothetical protein [Cellulomonas cellasea]MBB2923622.1 hypothetical protein [Cellulomonas cellasea]